MKDSSQEKIVNLDQQLVKISGKHDAPRFKVSKEKKSKKKRMLEINNALEKPSKGGLWNYDGISKFGKLNRERDRLLRQLNQQTKIKKILRKQMDNSFKTFNQRLVRDEEKDQEDSLIQEKIYISKHTYDLERLDKKLEKVELNFRTPNIFKKIKTDLLVIDQVKFIALISGFQNFDLSFQVRTTFYDPQHLLYHKDLLIRTLKDAMENKKGFSLKFQTASSYKFEKKSPLIKQLHTQTQLSSASYKRSTTLIK